ncbi:DUF937 domain-containing protein [Mycobacterium shimoidei]|uniref:DUF937 domain-containing protein n=1 Tax=Mycobacterium shimoidei TaxID=29313 RepID=A0A1E3TKU7_MYCSH|nr:DUF937 domain-containing protein [Mycobacterium shimoidei]MCV7259880.1 DUF937 domain-containing protein [Mycobacterium shimoidei]ODR15068.1 hypothetical protein BHQ16_03330 [Mycobacterium shimoidei]ORW79234.1 hypothetical protein AWC26_16745 [Mycobacterium shimoidei]SRX94574.1 hypothetical protein [Rhodococcus jostii RHA1] [Mycobacterium shimoidei]
MAGLDDLYAQIPTRDIAGKFGVEESDVNNAVQLLVPVLVGGLHQNAQDAEHASAIESAASSHAARGLLDTGVNVDDVDQADGQKAIAKIFGGNDPGQVAAALSGSGAGNSDLIQKLLPILAPIVLAYIGKQMTEKKAPAPTEEKASGGALNDVLGSILGGMAGGGNKSLPNVLGSVLGNKAGEILGGLFGKK